MVLDSLVINRNTKIEFSVVKEIRHYVMVCKNCGERIRTAPKTFGKTHVNTEL